jgi:hypothetical protein
MDYDKERIHEALGLDKEALDAIIKKSIDAHNGVDGNLLARHLASVTAVRTHCIGEVAEAPIAYEQLLAAVHFNMGAKLIASSLVDTANTAEQLVKAGAPKDAVLALVMCNVYKILQGMVND